MKLWGVTGLMGAGKSAALKYLEDCGHPVLDTDVTSREVVDPSRVEGRATLQELVQAFGADVLNAQGGLDRAGMRSRIAKDATARLKLESILHPRIRQRTRDWAKGFPGRAAGFVEGTRFSEVGFYDDFTGLIVVTAPISLRLDRVEKRSGISRDDAIRLMGAQDEAGLLARADETWVNDGHLKLLKSQIDAFLIRHGF